MKAIVIGGSGYLGRHVVDALLREGHTVSIVGRDPRPPGIPNDVTVHQGDASNLGRAQWEPILAGHDALVFAAGVDSRFTPPRPSSVFFHRHNVHAVTRMMHAARHAGITRAVIHNSYMVTIAREHPDLCQADRHPYIASRVDQILEARDAVGPDCSVASLEIPYVFGATPHRPHQFARLVPWLRGDAKVSLIGTVPLFAPPGGTAVTSAAAVGVATCRALESRLDGDFPVAQANLTWRELVTRLAHAAGNRNATKILDLPGPLMQTFFRIRGVMNQLRGHERGLEPRQYARMFTSEMFIDTCRPELGINDADLDTALCETVSEEAAA